MIQTRKRPDGTSEAYRPKLDYSNARYYTASPSDVDVLKDLGQTYDEAMTERDGALRGWSERGTVRRDGKTYKVLQAPGMQYAVEAHVGGNGFIDDARPLPPEQAYELARANDPPEVVQEWTGPAPQVLAFITTYIVDGRPVATVQKQPDGGLEIYGYEDATGDMVPDPSLWSAIEPASGGNVRKVQHPTFHEWWNQLRAKRS